MEAHFTLVPSSPNTERQRYSPLLESRAQPIGSFTKSVLCCLLPGTSCVRLRSGQPHSSKLQTLNTIQPNDVTPKGNPQLHTEVALMLFIEWYLVLNLMRISLRSGVRGAGAALLQSLRWDTWERVEVCIGWLK